MYVPPLPIDCSICLALTVFLLQSDTPEEYFTFFLGKQWPDQFRSLLRSFIISDENTGHRRSAIRYLEVACQDLEFTRVRRIPLAYPVGRLC